MINELLILIAKLENPQYLLLSYVIERCNSDGQYVFNKKHFILNEERETPEYLIRSICSDLFNTPMALRKTASTCVVRPFSNFCSDSTIDISIQLSTAFVQYLEQLRKALQDGELKKLRSLKDEISMSIYLNVRGVVELTEGEVRDLVFDSQTTRFSNIVERKIKPSMNNIHKTLGKNTSHIRLKIDGKPMMKLSIT